MRVKSPPIDPADLTEDWITTEQAAELLNVQPSSLLKVRGQTVRRVRCDARGRNAAGTCRWWKRDIQQLAAIRKEVKVSLPVALRIMAARGGHA